MAQAAVIDRSRFELALDARIVRGEAWTDLGATQALLDRAEACYREAIDEAESERKRARDEGFAAGRAQGLADIASTLLRVQRDSAALLAREESRIVELAVAIVARIAPGLDPAALMPSLVAEAVREVQAEQFLQVRVHPDALAAVEAETNTLRRAHPGLAELGVVADAGLPRDGCVLESEAGKVEAGVDEQLAAIRTALLRAAAEKAR